MLALKRDSKIVISLCYFKSVTHSNNNQHKMVHQTLKLNSTYESKINVSSKINNNVFALSGDLKANVVTFIYTFLNDTII